MAKARWQKALPSLSPTARQALGIPSRLDPSTLAHVRGNLWDSGDFLSHDGMARRARLEDLASKELRRRHFNEGPKYQAGAAFARSTDTTPGAFVLTAPPVTNNHYHPARGPGELHPYHPARELGELHHELAEQALLRAHYPSAGPREAMNTYGNKAVPPLDPAVAVKGVLPNTSIAHHRGAAPMLAENLAAHAFSGKRQAFEQLRSNPIWSDALEISLQKKLKQFGHTGAYPLPLGGRQHARLEDWALAQSRLGPGESSHKKAPPLVPRDVLMAHLSAPRRDSENVYYGYIPALP